MNNNIQLSFCLPVYNVVCFVEQCLQSICKQITNDLRYEILFLDDCSTDGSYELLKQLADKYPNVKVLQNERNSGVSFTRNELIRKACGKYIWFVDPDDMLYPDIAYHVLQVAEDTNVDVILGSYLKVPEECKQKFEPLTSITVSRNSDLKVLPADTNGTRMCAIWAGLFRRDFLLENNLFFNEKMIAQEDTLYYYEMSLRTTNIYRFDEPAYLYRQRSTSVMHTHDSKRALKYYHSMLEMYRVYKHHYDTGDFDNEAIILNKLAHMRQNLALTVVGLQDTRMVVSEFKKLKQEKLYPYTQKYLPPSGMLCVILKILPYEIGFWLIHLFYKIRYLIVN